MAAGKRAHGRMAGGLALPMKPRLLRWWWLWLVIPMAFGLARLHFDVEVMNLLPADLPVVEGLKLYQKHFANADELIVTVQSSDPEATEAAARELALALRAQTNLVARYVNGQGVVRDYVRAHMWFSLVAVSGDVDAVKNRDFIAKRMTPQQIAQAHQMARDCQQRNFKGCE